MLDGMGVPVSPPPPRLITELVLRDGEYPVAAGLRGHSRRGGDVPLRVAAGGCRIASLVDDPLALAAEAIRGIAMSPVGCQGG